MLCNNHGLLRDNASIILVAQRLLDPTIAVLLLIVLADIYNVTLYPPHLALSIIVFGLIISLFKEFGLYHPYRALSPALLGTRLLLGWGIAIAVLLFLGYLTETSALFSRSLLLTWSCCVPLILFGIHLTAWKLLRRLRAIGRNTRTAVIAGVNEVSHNLVSQIVQSPELGINVKGFFDNYSSIHSHELPILGTLNQLPHYIREHHVDVVYITCTDGNDAAVTTLISELQDTTASVYFVPNLLMSHLTHGRPYELNGVPLIAIWEVPFTEIQYILKRTIDILLATFAIVVLSPIMVLIAIAVKLSSPGPILFRQRRYGLNGHEITVYKFRSMTVLEDGDTIIQASRNDSRVTAVGKLLRKTSLDELPQFVNVLQGRMSIVGPRPHAVSHNEIYRKVIDGYMLRHKVKPGITGWAQVNGYRGETDTLDKMQQRVKYDLDYLKNWSLGLDLQIIFKTPFVLIGGNNAY